MRQETYTPAIDPADSWTHTWRITEKPTTVEKNISNRLYAGTGIDGGPEKEVVDGFEILVERRMNFGYADDAFEKVASYFDVGLPPNAKIYRDGGVVGRQWTFEAVCKYYGVPILGRAA